MVITRSSRLNWLRLFSRKKLKPGGAGYKRVRRFHFQQRTKMNGNNHLLDALTREGVLISVSVRYWRATRKLNPEDLGLDPDNVTERLISLGHKKLLPG